MGDAHGEGLLVRIHSECFTGDVLGSQRCDCGEQLTQAMQAIAAEGRGALIYLRQEGRGIGLEEKLRAYNLQDEGYDTVDANLLLGHQADERDYTAAALILQELGARSVRLLTNNPAKIEGLAALGIEVQERIPLQTPSNPESRAYLEAKAARMRHIIQLNGRSQPDGKQGSEPAEGYRPQLEGLRARMEGRSDASAPFVTLSYAQSLDGSLTTRQGTSYPISAPASLTMTHSLRAAHSAILVGIGTVLADDPALTVGSPRGTVPSRSSSTPICARRRTQASCATSAPPGSLPPPPARRVLAGGGWSVPAPASSPCRQMKLAAWIWLRCPVAWPRRASAR